MTLTTEILVGLHDADLRSIKTAVARRLRATQAEQAANFAPGDRVVLRDVSPKYLTGQVATVVARRRSKLAIQLVTPVGRFGEGTIEVPATCVEMEVSR